MDRTERRHNISRHIVPDGVIITLLYMGDMALLWATQCPMALLWEFMRALPEQSEPHIMRMIAQCGIASFCDDSSMRASY